MPTRSRAALAGIAFSLLLARPAFAQQSHAASEFYALPVDAADTVGLRPSGVAAATRSPIAAPAPTSRAVVLQTTRGAQSSSSNEQRARARFEAGVHFADSLQWSEAADAFEESYRLFPRPATLRNLALAHRALGRYMRAVEELQQFIQEGNPEGDVAAQVNSIIGEMSAQLATITVVSSVSNATITLDDRPIRANEEIRLDPGNHIVAGTAPGYVRAAQTLTVTRSEQRRVDLRFEHGSGGILSQWWFWTGVGVIVAGGVALTVVLLSHEEQPNCGTLNVCVSPQ